MNRTVSLTAALTIAFWTIALALFAIGCGVALADTEDALNRTWGAILLGVGMLFVAAALASTVSWIANRKADKIIDCVELHSDVRNRVRGL